MEKPELVYMPRINLLRIKDCILDNGVQPGSKMLLRKWDFDSMVFEYNSTYGPFFKPFKYIGVEIEESDSIPQNHVGIIHWEEGPEIAEYERQEVDMYSYYEIHRCGKCGALVDEHGHGVSQDEHRKQAAYLQKFPGTNIVKHVHGRCCFN